MVQTSFTPGDLWSNPAAVADVLQTRRGLLEAERGPARNDTGRASN